METQPIPQPDRLPGDAEIVLDFRTGTEAAMAVLLLRKRGLRSPVDQLLPEALRLVVLFGAVVLYVAGLISTAVAAALLIGLIVSGSVHEMLRGLIQRRFGPDEFREVGRLPLSVRLGPAGVTLTNPMATAWYSWAAIPAAPVWPEGMVLRFGPNVAVPVPAGRLPDGISVAELGRRIDAWRGVPA